MKPSETKCCHGFIEAIKTQLEADNLLGLLTFSIDHASFTILRISDVCKFPDRRSNTFAAPAASCDVGVTYL